MSKPNSALKVTAVTASAQLGGTERMLLDFASRAFEHDIALRVLTPLKGPLVQIFKNIGIPTAVVPAPQSMLRGSQQVGHLSSLPPALVGMWRWSRRLAAHEFLRDADVAYSVAFKSHLALALARCRPVVWHLHEFPPETTGRLWRGVARWVPNGLIANSQAVGEAWWGRRGAASREPGAEGAEGEEGKGRRGAASREPGAEGLKEERGRGKGEKGTADRDGVAYRRTVVIPNGINLDRFKPRERTYWIHDQLGIPREHRLVGMPAVFARWKGQIEVIEAFNRLAEEFYNVHLVIVGGSIYETLAEREFGRELAVEIDRAATGEWAVVSVPGSREPGAGRGRWEEGKGRSEEGAGSRGDGERGAGPDGVRSNSGRAGEGAEINRPAEGPAPRSALPQIHHLPFQPKIEGTYPEFDLAVHYSLRPEPFGRVIVEAMACGIPVIAADEGGPREILGDRVDGRYEAGWLAEPRNPDALAEVLRTALSTPPDEAREIGQAGRRRAEDHYSWRQFAGEVAEVLKCTAEAG